MTQLQMQFKGTTFSASKDGKRLARQLESVKALLLDGQWRTLSQISEATGAPEASASARIRDCANKLGMKKERRRVPGGNGLHEYRLVVG